MCQRLAKHEAEKQLLKDNIFLFSKYSIRKLFSCYKKLTTTNNRFTTNSTIKKSDYYSARHQMKRKMHQKCKMYF